MVGELFPGMEWVFYCLLEAFDSAEINDKLAQRCLEVLLTSNSIVSSHTGESVGVACVS